MTRPTCLKCCRKHLMQARAIMLEVKKGYPAFWEYAVGHLAEAEDEVVLSFPEFANEIRKERVTLEDAKGEYAPNWERFILGLRRMMDQQQADESNFKTAMTDWLTEVDT